MTADPPRELMVGVNNFRESILLFRFFWILFCFASSYIVVVNTNTEYTLVPLKFKTNFTQPKFFYVEQNQVYFRGSF